MKRKKRAPAKTRVPAESARGRPPARPSKPLPATEGPAAKPGPWLLRLYVSGQTPNSLTAFSNLKSICDAHLAGRYEIEVIDLTKAPHRAHDDQIVALPTLVRKRPEPVKRVIGNLSNVERVLSGMEVPLKVKQNLAR